MMSSCLDVNLASGVMCYVLARFDNNTDLAPIRFIITGIRFRYFDLFDEVSHTSGYFVFGFAFQLPTVFMECFKSFVPRNEKHNCYLISPAKFRRTLQ